MRSIAKINRLKGMSSTLPDILPRPVTATYRAWLNNVREVLSNNSLGTDWEFDEHRRVLYTTWTRSRGGPDEELAQMVVGLSIEHYVTLDPLKPLDEEVSRLIDERKRFDTIADSALRAAAATLLSRETNSKETDPCE